jgi:hypothetical protein
MFSKKINKMIGLLIILSFIISLVPTSSMAEKIQAGADDLILNKSLPELNNIAEENGAERISEENLTFYYYISNKLHFNITGVEYAHLLNVLCNKTEKPEAYSFYTAYVTNPDTVYNGPFPSGIVINGLTPRQIRTLIPFLSTMIDQFDAIVTEYGRMSIQERAEYINTIVPNEENTLDLYNNVDIDTFTYMLNQSDDTLKDLSDIGDRANKSVGWYLGHPGQVKDLKNDASDTIDNFYRKSVNAYSRYQIDENIHTNMSILLNSNFSDGTIAALTNTKNYLVAKSHDSQIHGIALALYGSLLIPLGLLLIVVGGIAFTHPFTMGVTMAVVLVLLGMLLWAAAAVMICLSTVLLSEHTVMNNLIASIDDVLGYKLRDE